MKITLFTADQPRHNYLITLLAKISKKLYVIQEKKVTFSSAFPNNLKKPFAMATYFKKVQQAENKLFLKKKIIKNKKIKIHKVKIEDNINKIEIKKNSTFFNSNIYIVFGSSYLKGHLVDFLIKNRAINIHLGISPYYRGTDCNFWALYDNNPHLVGATIHLLSKGLDNGPILYHAMSKPDKSSFNYTMTSAMAAFYSLVEKIKDKTIFTCKTYKQKKIKEIRYTKKKDFNEEVVIKFLKKKINLNSKKINKKMYKNLFLLK